MDSAAAPPCPMNDQRITILWRASLIGVALAVIPWSVQGQEPIAGSGTPAVTPEKTPLPAPITNAPPAPPIELIPVATQPAPEVPQEPTAGEPPVKPAVQPVDPGLPATQPVQVPESPPAEIKPPVGEVLPPGGASANTTLPTAQPAAVAGETPAVAPAVAGSDAAGVGANQPAAGNAPAPVLLSVPMDLASVSAALERLVADHGALARPLDLGLLADGRKLPAIVFGAEGPLALEERPTVLLLGAFDGEAPTGGLAVLAVCAELLREAASLPAGVAFAAVPWASPEAVELSLLGHSSDGRNLRPLDEDRDGRVDEDGPDDLDGDGQILQMLVEDPDGPWTRQGNQRLLARAKAGDAPRFSLSLEGKDDDGDGRFNEDGPGGVVLDLNFPVGRVGPWVDPLSGVLPLSESLSRTYADFALARRAAIVIVFQGSHGRLAIPGGTKSTSAAGWMPDADRSVFERAGSAFQATTLRRNSPISTLLECRGRERPGASIDWFYSVGGALALELAPWGPALDAAPDAVPENARFDSTRGDKKIPDGVSSEDLAWIRWLDDSSGGIGFIDWHPVALGNGAQALVGGWEPGTRTIPPADKLARALQGLGDFTRRLSASLPRLELRVIEASRDGEVCRIRARLANAGVLPTGLSISDRRHGSVGAWLALELPAGARLVAGLERSTLARLAGGGISRECEWIVVAPAGSTFSLRAGGDWALSVAKEVKP